MENLAYCISAKTVHRRQHANSRCADSDRSHVNLYPGAVCVKLVHYVQTAKRIIRLLFTSVSLLATGFLVPIFPQNSDAVSLQGVKYMWVCTSGKISEATQERWHMSHCKTLTGSRVVGLESWTWTQVGLESDFLRTWTGLGLEGQGLGLGLEG